MFESNKRTCKLLSQTVVALVLLQVLIGYADAAAKCHKCIGINCQRTSYTATDECVDALDSCVSIFEGSTVLAQGCLGKLAIELRNKCQRQIVNLEGEDEVGMEGEELPMGNGDCYQCNEDLCNNLSGERFKCLQCDSNSDGNCASKPENLQAEKCPIARSVNSYCYTKLEGKRAIRGCATNLAQQNECLSNNDCTLCSPLDISGCNRDPKIASDDTGSGSESGGSSSGSGDGGSSSGGGAGTGDGGSSSGGGSGGNGSGTDEGGSSSGSGSGGSGGSGGGGGGGDGGGDGGGGPSTGDGGSSAGGDGSGSSNGDGSGNDTSDSGNSNSSGAIGVSNYKHFTTTILILLAFFQF